MPRRLLFDVTGLIQWYAYFRQPSGIQRVTEKLIGSRPVRRASNVEFVARVLGSDVFYKVDAELLRSLNHPALHRPAIARLRRLFSQSMGLARISELRQDARYFHLPYIGFGLTGFHSLIEAWFNAALPAYSAAIEIASPPGPSDTFFNLGDFWSHKSYVDTVIRLKRHTNFRLIQMVHDLFAVDQPKWGHPDFGQLMIGGIRQLAPFVDGWMTNSHFVQAQLRRYLVENGFPQRSIVPLPMGRTSLAEASDPNPRRITEVLGRYGLSGRPFVLHVGTIEPRKNLLTLLDALGDLRARLGPRVPMCVLVGRDGWSSESIRKRLNKESEAGTALWLRNVSDADLPAFYRAARFSVVPSFAEGWGLPVQESLSFGLPCIAANTGGLPEAGGNLAQYFNPNSTAELSEVLATWITDDSALEAARIRLSRALELGPPITWDLAGELLLEQAL